MNTQVDERGEAGAEQATPTVLMRISRLECGDVRRSARAESEMREGVLHVHPALLQLVFCSLESSRPFAPIEVVRTKGAA